MVCRVMKWKVVDDRKCLDQSKYENTRMSVKVDWIFFKKTRHLSLVKYGQKADLLSHRGSIQ